MLHRAARNAYSWWWASHVRTKQSKWLDQNLQDMEEKVEYILKIIDEDADTFRQRAEMYYKKRPELVNFVEDSFRGYRALAERYDHLSRELQSANRTIASVFPESVHLPMGEDDFDGENLRTTAMPFDEFNILSKNPPPAPEISIPKNDCFPKKNVKMPSRLMSRKGLVKTNAGDAAAAIPVSGLNKSEALQKIDKFQKDILALQTEKEFVKSSYECGLEKYWNIEKQITEMQAEVSNLQDEFGIGTVIEDDEARTLMTATALKSCQEALTRLQEKQEQSAKEAQEEFHKLQETREKFKSLKENVNTIHAHQEVQLEAKNTMNHNMEANKQDQEVDSDEQNIYDVESLRKRIKEELQLNLGSSLTMSELAEKVDELVDKIINLESAVSSQTAHVKRLRSETNELQTHLQSLEEEKETLIEGSHDMISKIKDLEEELQRVQSLNKCIQEKNNHLQAHYIEASCNLDDLSEKLLYVKPEVEAENLALFSKDTDVPGANPPKKIQFHEKKHTQNVQENFRAVNIEELEKQADKPDQNTCKIEELKSPVKTNSSDYHTGVLPYREVKSTSDANSELKVQEIPPCRSGLSPGKVKSNDIKGHSNSTSAESKNDLLSNQSQSQFNSLSGSSLNVNLEKWFGEAKDGIGTGYGSMITNNTVKHNLGDSRTFGKVTDESFFQLNQQNNTEDFLTAQEKATPDAHPQKGSCQSEAVSPPGYHIETLENVRTGEKGLKEDILEHSCSSIGGKGSPDRRFKEEGNVTDPCHNLFIEGHMKVESKPDDFFNSNWDNRMDGYRLKSQVRDLLDANLEKSDSDSDEVVPGKKMEMKGEILGHSTIQSASESHPRSAKVDHCGNLSIVGAFDKNRDQEQEKNEIHANLSPKKPSSNSGDSRLNNQLNDLPMNIQVKSISETSQLKEFVANEENTAPDKSTASGYLVTEDNPKKYNLPDQGNDQEVRQQPVHPIQQHDLSRDEVELAVEDDDQPNWKELFLSGLDDKEKLLLHEYTSILRNYKEARKKLNEMEKKKRASLFQYCIQIKVLKSANASKDLKIESLEKKLNFHQENKDATFDSRETRASASFPVHDDQPLLTDQKALPYMMQDPTSDSIDKTEESPAQEQPNISFVEEDGGIKVINIDKHQNLSVVEERIRTDIDELLEENIGFWMKFSTSLHQVQKFQTTVQDLQAELAKVKEHNKHSGSTNPQSLLSDIRPIYRHLSGIQTELSLWLDQNAMLKDDLDHRLSSLSVIQEEITRLSNAGSRVEETELSDYQAAKFHGEVLNMKQENNKVADELHLGVERVKVILVEIERTLRELDTEFGVSARKPQSRNSTIRSKIPLRTFLFGVKLKKQKPSFFACISPSLQKQYSDLTTLPT